MTVNYLTGSNPIWTFFDNSGQLLQNGFLEMLSSLDPNVEKLCFRDPAGIIPYENPLELNDTGQTSALIYFADDEPYYINIRDVNHEIINTIPRFVPNGSSGGGITTEIIDQNNHFLNPQLEFPFLIPSPLPATPIHIAQGNWSFNKSNTAATDSLAIVKFPLGQTDVPAQPSAFFQYICTGIGAGGEIYKDVVCRMCRVDGFNQDIITLASRLISATTSTIQIIAQQFFGTGGTPSATVNTILLNFPALTEFSSASITTVLPSTAGKTLGTNGDDALNIIFRMPLNQISNVGGTNFQLVHGTILPDMEHQSDSYIRALVLGNDLPIPAVDGSDAGKSLTLSADGQTNVWGNSGQVGSIRFESALYPENTKTGIVDLTNWLLADGRALSRITYAALNTYYANGATPYPWGAGDGVSTFNLANFAGRAISSIGNNGTDNFINPGNAGSARVSISVDNLPPHIHAQNVTAGGGQSAAFQRTTGSASKLVDDGETDSSASSSAPRLTTDSTGSGTPILPYQPTSFIPIYIKVL